MKLAFVVIVILMVLVTIGVVVVPLLRRGRQQGRPRSVFLLALLFIVAVPLITLGLYLKIGTPATLDGVVTQPPAVTIDQALADLRAHLAQQPDDLQGWLLLAQTSTAMHQPDAARNAYDRVLKLDAGNTDAMVGWAEADSMLQPDHVISERARQLLKQAVDKQPDNQRGLWLLGISQFQQNQFTDAAATWRQLQPMLQPGSAVASAVADQIKAADARAGDTSAKAPDSAAQSKDAAQRRGPALRVNVQLAPALSARVGRGDTLFIYARPPDGPPMPLAVARMEADTLPVSVTLTDAMAMTPQRTLSSVPKVFVGARISHSGQAIAQPGDLEGDAGVVAVDATGPIHITIDKVH
ncbi:tetratricopeptide repeat protein [Rhodanobacter sp. BL-MT-08]